MQRALKRSGKVIAFTALAAASLLSLSCAQNSAEADKANAKRWDNFQKDNKRDMTVGASAFEKRQAQLAEKRRKEAEKPVTKPSADAPSASEPSKTEKKPN